MFLTARRMKWKTANGSNNIIINILVNMFQLREYFDYADAENSLVWRFLCDDDGMRYILLHYKCGQLLLQIRRIIIEIMIKMDVFVWRYAQVMMQITEQLT